MSAPAPPIVPAPEAPPPVDSAQRTWAMLCHLSTFAGLFVPLGNILGPLVVWLLKREGMPLVEEQGREALNFQISITLYLLVAGLATFVLIGFLLVPAVLVFDLVVTIQACLRAHRGQAYRYPLSIRFVR